MDPEFVAQSIPGVETVERVDATHYKVISGFGMGALGLSFSMDVEITASVAPERGTMRVRGEAPGADLDVTASFLLEEQVPGRTVMHWICEGDVSGVVASVGGSLFEGTARKLADHFWLDVGRRVQLIPAHDTATPR